MPGIVCNVCTTPATVKVSGLVLGCGYWEEDEQQLCLPFINVWNAHGKFISNYIVVLMQNHQ